MPVPTIEAVYPSNNQTGVVLGTTIQITFDREVDVTSLVGSLVVEGPDTDRWTGPGMAAWDLPDTETTENILDSPDFKGIVQGVITAELLNESNQSVSGPDYSGLGSGNTTYKHRITFTPNHILSPNTEYTVYIAGDEDLGDGFNVGVATRTVFAALAGTNLGDGVLVPSGGYVGASDDIFRFEVTSSGGYGDATYQYYRASMPHIIRTGTISASSSAIPGGEGLVINWSGEGTNPFIDGDTFSVQVRAPLYMTATYKWVFTTGSGSITTIPSTTSTSPLGDIGQPVAAPLEIIAVDPDVRESGVPTSTRVIKVTFNKELDASTVNDLAVTVEALPVNGDDSIASPGVLNKILRVEDNILYIILQSGRDPS